MAGPFRERIWLAQLVPLAMPLAFQKTDGMIGVKKSSKLRESVADRDLRGGTGLT